MTAKTAEQRFNDALTELKALESEGYACGPVSRLSLSATGRVKQPEPRTERPKTAAAFIKDKDEAKS